jgi:hypothetical protein
VASLGQVRQRVQAIASITIYDILFTTVATRWLVEFYEDADGCPVRDFLNGRPQAQRAKIIAIIKLLEEQGPTLPFPYSSQVRGKLRELRTHYGAEHYRVLYFGTSNRVFVLLAGLVKRTATIDEREIALCEGRMKRVEDGLRRKGKGKR